MVSSQCTCPVGVRLPSTKRTSHGETKSASKSATRPDIGIVVLWRSQEQVIGVNARPHAASVADKKTGRNRTVPGHPGSAVGIPFPQAYRQHSITLRIARTCPQHTSGLGIARAPGVET